MPDVHRPFPVEPLLLAFRATLPVSVEAAPTGARSSAIRHARRDWLNQPFLDGASPEQLAARVSAFYAAVTEPGWHSGLVSRSVALLRHGLNHLLRGDDPLPVRFARCASYAGSYHIPGLGLSFWTAILKALDPDRIADWNRPLRHGLYLLGFIPDTRHTHELSIAFQAFNNLRVTHSDFTTAELEEFLARVAVMRGREIPSEAAASSTPAIVADAIRAMRVQTALRRRIEDEAEHHRAARAMFDTATASGDMTVAAGAAWYGNRTPDAPLPTEVVAALRVLHPLLAEVHGTDDLARVWDSTPRPTAAVVRLVAGILHLRRPDVFPEWRDTTARGVAVVDDAFDVALPPAIQYQLAVDVAGVLRQRFRVHPSEVGPLLAALGGSEGVDRTETTAASGIRLFGGFCSDTFRFFAELAVNNSKTWMTQHRERYQFVVRDPLTELCTAVAERYVRPVLGGEYGWDLETDARAGRALSSIVKNDFGRSGPYVPVGWVTFYRRQLAHKRDDVQLFVRVAADGVSVGFHLGRQARDAGRRFRANIQEHGALAFAALAATGAADQCLFGFNVDPASAKPVRSATDLREWAAAKDLFAWRWFPPDASVLRADEFAGEVLILFDRLVPLFAAAVEDDPRPILAARAGRPDAKPAFDREAFRKATSLSDVWLTRVLDLLQLKKQLVLQGVPGTGKTHVARSLARLIAGDRAEAVRLVQFHPGYSYEEFVEGIRPKAAGGPVVEYPVEPGLLAEFAARAERHPADPHVLVVDEINRGNLPRVFGELLFLLEYRDQEVTLPYSKRAFRLPPNLYLIGTMNPADRSAVGLDPAMRRRFSFVDMPPDPALLALWLDAHPPADPDPTFGPRVVEWFEGVNRRLARDLGPDRQIGHSALMVPGLTADTLRAVWEHHVRPALDDFYAGQPDRVRAFAPPRRVAVVT